MVTLGNRWDQLLEEEFGKAYYLQLREFLKTEYNSYRVYDRITHKTGHCSEDTDYLFVVGSEKVKILELVPEDEDILILGLLDKYIPKAAVDSVHWFKNHCLVKVNCSGSFGFITLKKVKKVYLDNEEVSFEKEDELYQIRVEHESSEIVIVY